ncbi:MAG TPA: site-2 protease family protein [Candidatus Polarisedimenticolaceae bacterium]|nr:site-2 protease family protein [Candidatus Polarisedimenticolaceae bacterium]
MLPFRRVGADTLPLLGLWYAVFLLSLTCHEAAHAFAAWRGGDPTAYEAGQVSLSPWPHIRREPWGTVLVPLLTFFMYAGSGSAWMMGWASAPYDPVWENRHPRRAAVMALAGPFANLALVACAFASLAVLFSGGVLVPPDRIGIDRLAVAAPGAAPVFDGVARLLSILLSLNLLLCVFNLMPCPPLDGASVLAGVLPPARTLRDRLRASPFGSMVAFVVALVLFPRVVAPLVFRLLSVLLGFLFAFGA